jgi:hypothetical protein
MRGRKGLPDFKINLFMSESELSSSGVSPCTFDPLTVDFSSLILIDLAVLSHRYHVFRSPKMIMRPVVAHCVEVRFRSALWVTKRILGC